MKLANMTDVNYALKIIGEKKGFISKKEADMNFKLNQIKEKFEAEVETEQKEIDTLTSDVQAFCVNNKELFEKVRSKVLNFGTVGFRNTPPKVTLLNKKYNMKTVLELVNKIFTGNYVRVKEELDKDAILSAYTSKELDDSKLAAIGLRIDNSEMFFLEINWQALEPAGSQQAAVSK